MDALSLVRWGGLSGLLGVSAVLITAIVGLAAGHDPQEWSPQDIDTILASMSQNTNLYLLSMWGFVLGYTLLMVFALGVHRTLPGRQGILGIAPWSLLLGLAILNLLALLAIGMTLGLADAYTVAAGAERVFFETLAVTLVHFENHARALAYVLLAIGVLFFGLRVLQSSPSPLPRWLGWTAVIAGVLGLGGSLRLGPEFLFVFSALGNLIQLLGFILPAGVVMLRLRALPGDVPELDAKPPTYATSGES